MAVDSEQAQPKRHSWEKHDKHHRTYRDFGIKVLARPHPYERRCYQEYTTADGRCLVADRVPPCEPAAQPQPMADDERVRHASALDHAAGRAWRQGDLQRAARLIADARALDPACSVLWAKQEAAITASAQRAGRSAQAGPVGHQRNSTEPSLCQSSNLAGQQPGEADDPSQCQGGHPVSDLRQDIAARLMAAGFTVSSPELARVRQWNRAALERARTAQADEVKEAEAT